MTAGKGNSTRASPPSNNRTSRTYFDHSTAPRINTDTIIVSSLRAEYPNLHLTVTPLSSCNLLSYASAGNAGLAPIDKEQDRLSWSLFFPPATRLDGGKGVLGESVKFGKYLLDWQGKEFVLFVVDGRDGTNPYVKVVNQYILSPSPEATNRLLLEAGSWNTSLHGEIWVFDGGYWQKSAELWDSVKKASWEDVILDEKMKDAVRADVTTFFDSRATYEKLKVPWKRGIIYYGPPGNGKTISVKATMHMLYERKDPIPTLYVRSLSSFGGPEYSINQIFSLARRTAPCYLVFEDLDSIVTDNVRSYFLNEVDGIKKNDGILMVGSTNHLDRLDPGISKRPSRFDRKYLFPNPNEAQREQYAKYWQGKLSDNHDLEFPDKLCPAIAKITDKFSFAYMQEAMVASLLAIARDDDGFSDAVCLACDEPHSPMSKVAEYESHVKEAASAQHPAEDSFVQERDLIDFLLALRRMDDSDPSLEDLVLWREIKKQVKILRGEMGEEESSAGKSVAKKQKGKKVRTGGLTAADLGMGGISFRGDGMRLGGDADEDAMWMGRRM